MLPPHALIYFSSSSILPHASRRGRWRVLTNRLPQARWFPGNGDVADDSGKTYREAPALHLQEGSMARPDFPLNIDRRRLMTAAAAVTATGVLPGVKLADAAAPDFSQSSQLTHQAESTMPSSYSTQCWPVFRR